MQFIVSFFLNKAAQSYYNYRQREFQIVILFVSLGANNNLFLFNRTLLYLLRLPAAYETRTGNIWDDKWGDFAPFIIRNLIICKTLKRLQKKRNIH